MVSDVPSPIDLRSMTDAREWAESAMVKRPWRTQFFDKIVEQIPTGTPRVMELGSGPGFLAERLLQAHPRIEYVALDYSPAMHTLARERLGDAARQAQFIERDFRHSGWASDWPRFDFLVTVQAVHELRHKRHASSLYATIRGLLSPGGAFLMCDHFVGYGGMSNDELYMTLEEHMVALQRGGYAPVVLLERGGLILFRAIADYPATIEEFLPVGVDATYVDSDPP